MMGDGVVGGVERGVLDADGQWRDERGEWSMAEGGWGGPCFMEWGCTARCGSHFLALSHSPAVNSASRRDEACCACCTLLFLMCVC
ncbi:hypothetical protein CC85DRAFT_51648 [Cutaneotrichosporon oleaginosum]|uniref:Uncharacterized protein n=1 Tax=Cutaneotrichosporon oleaginosum TaxID=879819 RepID=A0A0J0XQK1_9TREE|nr:uncharacterized protein CC85DRAFT_51648 [Cutaneotrichosporon oleaginosum]KLT43378.1 hypothetical protein CC85DRAFT_51648 [Cutaneotrichosporon oleaginosum]TXT05408.1 hypothetical protein COLE_06728 [Cutaneotrichosporon oleaginosum]